MLSTGQPGSNPATNNASFTRKLIPFARGRAIEPAESYRPRGCQAVNHLVTCLRVTAAHWSSMSDMFSSVADFKKRQRPGTNRNSAT